MGRLKKHATSLLATLSLVTIVLLVTGWGSAAAANISSVFVTNGSSNPVPVREQNLDGSNIRVHEEGTANVNVTSVARLQAATTGASLGDVNTGNTGHGQEVIGLSTAQALAFHMTSGVNSVELKDGSSVVADFWGPVHDGQADVVVDLAANATSSLAANNNFRVVRSKPGRNFLIYINKTEGRVGADMAVRQAVAMAINTKDYTQAVFGGNADPGRWMAPESVLGTSAQLVKAPVFDPKQATTVLDSAGWKAGADGIRVKDGRRLTMKLLGQADTPAGSGEFIQSQLKSVGIEMQIVPTPDTATRNTLYNSGKGDFDLDLEGPNQNDGNPAFLPVLRMYSKNANTAQFAPGADFDALADKTFTAPTTSEVQQLAAQMMKVLIDDTYIVVPLAGAYRIYGMSSKVNLSDPHPSNTNQTWFSLTKTK